MKVFLAAAVLMASTSAFANMVIECGTQVNKEDGTVGKTAFLLSSEDDGPLNAFDSAGKKISGSKIQLGPNGSLVLTIQQDQGLGGPVGVKYIIEQFRGVDFTKAQKVIMGGFAGGSTAGTLDCVVSEM